MTRSVSLFKAIALVICSIYFTPGLCDKNGDCMYNTCEWKKLQYSGGHEPCLGTGGRGLVRNVECDDGNTIHICCRMPYRDDIQKSRQKWFRGVTDTASSRVGSSCTKRILCEMACRDGLNGQTRSDYPQVLPSDTPENQEYVEAYVQGERQSCYNHNQTNSKSKNPAQDENQYDSKACDVNCQVKYPECDRDIADSRYTQFVYNFAIVGHELGMLSFKLTWLVQDTFDKAVDVVVSVGQAVKRAYINLYDRMSRMNNDFMDYQKNGVDLDLDRPSDRRRRDVSDANNSVPAPTPTTENWNKFLIFYNKTDPRLVDSVYESLNYTQYTNAMNVINEILSTYDFGPGEDWTDSGSNNVGCFMYSTILVFLISSFF